MRAALEASQQARTAAEQQAAVLAAKLEGVTAQLTHQAEANAEARKLAAQEAHRAAERMTQAQAERDEARKVAADARELAARLAGQLEVFTAQKDKADSQPAAAQQTTKAKKPA